MKDRSQSRIRFTRKLLEMPILRASLKQYPLLQNLLVIRAPNNTNYNLTPEQWKRVHNLKE